MDFQISLMVILRLRSKGAELEGKRGEKDEKKKTNLKELWRGFVYMQVLWHRPQMNVIYVEEFFIPVGNTEMGYFSGLAIEYIFK